MERIPKGIYNPEFREQAVRLYEIDKLTLPEVARRLSLPQGTLKSWVYASRRGKLGEVGRNQKLLPDLEMELARVKRDLAEVKMERYLLKKAAATARKSRGEVKYGRIKEWRLQYPIAVMCRVFNVSESGYHAWRDRPLSRRAFDNGRLEIEIQAAH